MRALTLATLGLAAGPAAALTPLPPACAYSGDTAEGRGIVFVATHANRFVSYITTDDTDREWFYLEHCPTGQTLRARSAPRTASLGNTRHPENVRQVMFNALDAREGYTMGDIQGLLRAEGVATKRTTARAESCACHENFPDAVGAKTPYKKDTK
ncbi:hypothetical protein [Litoreibacter ponti]|nr:hypothetical protein [Litoreibacter ponti]